MPGGKLGKSLELRLLEDFSVPARSPPAIPWLGTAQQPAGLDLLIRPPDDRPPG